MFRPAHKGILRGAKGIQETYDFVRPTVWLPLIGNTSDVIGTIAGPTVSGTINRMHRDLHNNLVLAAANAAKITPMGLFVQRSGTQQIVDNRFAALEALGTGLIGNYRAATDPVAGSNAIELYGPSTGTVYQLGLELTFTTAVAVQEFTFAAKCTSPKTITLQGMNNAELSNTVQVTSSWALYTLRFATAVTSHVLSLVFSAPSTEVFDADDSMFFYGLTSVSTNLADGAVENAVHYNASGATVTLVHDSVTYPVGGVPPVGSADWSIAVEFVRNYGATNPYVLSFSGIAAMHLRAFDDGTLRFTYNTEVLTSSAGAISYKKKHRALLTYTHASTAPALWLDGVLVDSATGIAAPAGTATALALGRAPASAITGLNGFVTNYRMWSGQALTDWRQAYV